MISSVPTLDLSRLRASSSAACALLKAMANPDRLLLLCQLSQGERCVGELESLLAIRQPTLSQQLSVLREEGLVQTRRDGKQVFYSILSTPALALLQVLYSQFCASDSDPGQA